MKEIPVDRVHRATVAVRLKEIAKENGPVSANRARQCLSAFFGWAMREGLAGANPVLATNQAIEETSRERVLFDDELRAIWWACRDDTFGRLVRLLILTGQRRDEVGGITRDEISLDTATWALSAHRSKNGRPHEVPLSRPALEIVSTVVKEHERSNLFGNEGRGYSGWSTAKTTFDSRMKEAGASIDAWRLHDIRRTVATRLADLGTLPHIVEAILNHISGHKSGVAGVYNQATYAREKREALDLWAAHVGSLVQSD